jgi:hypothetical protein
MIENQSFRSLRHNRYIGVGIVSDLARSIISAGSYRIRVRRVGMLQYQVFRIRRVRLGNGHFVELFLDKVLDMSELVRVAEETGLPVEAQNGKAFPKGTSAKDFMDLEPTLGA